MQATGKRHVATAARAKGIAYVHIRDYVRSHFGASGWAAVLESFDMDERATLDSAVGVGWYELDLYARLLHAVERAHGTGNFELVKKMSAYQAERDTKIVFRLFFRLANPAYVIEKSGEYWRRFHESGTWEIVREGKHRCHGTLHDFGVVDRVLCTDIIYYIWRLIELVGGKNVQIVHPRCRADGFPACYYCMTWAE